MDVKVSAANYTKAVNRYIESQTELYIASEEAAATQSTNMHPEAIERLHRATVKDISAALRFAMTERLLDHMVSLEVAGKL